MASFSSTVGRAAAILTTGEVDGAVLDLDDSPDGAVTVDFTFTIGSLTNVIVRFYGSPDNSAWKPLYSGATAVTETLTASGDRHYAVRAPGVRYFKVSVQGTGTVTSSTCAFTYRYQAYPSTSNIDGLPRFV